VTAAVGAFILVMLTLLTECLVLKPTRTTAQLAQSRTSMIEASRRNSEALLTMGMLPHLMARWIKVNADYLASNRQASDAAGGFGAISKVLRMVLQSAVLGVGAYLVIYQQASAGIIIAGSILSARALAPIDVAIAHWRGWVAARQSWERLRSLLAKIPSDTEPMPLEPPHKSLIVENASVVPPGEQKPVVRDLSLKLQSGNALGVIGPSACGKSSTARMLVGYWAPTQGKVCLDGAALDQWAPHLLGRYIGYLPQHVELLDGTVAQNISRFEPEADPKMIRAAAAAAGVHHMIVSLPDGYDTQIGERGAALSAGQAQRIALARALYRDPFLVVLDEPNSNLDAEGDAALTQAILSIRARGGIAVVIAHRPSAIARVDLLLAMKEGRVAAFGPKDEVLAKVLHREPPPRPFKVVPESGSA
jgi:ATP-binding cassette subfamily C protein PrsD